MTSLTSPMSRFSPPPIYTACLCGSVATSRQVGHSIVRRINLGYGSFNGIIEIDRYEKFDDFFKNLTQNFATSV